MCCRLLLLFGRLVYYSVLYHLFRFNVWNRREWIAKIHEDYVRAGSFVCGRCALAKLVIRALWVLEVRLLRSSLKTGPALSFQLRRLLCVCVCVHAHTGRSIRVHMQADAEFTRETPDDQQMRVTAYFSTSPAEVTAAPDLDLATVAAQLSSASSITGILGDRDLF